MFILVFTDMIRFVYLTPRILSARVVNRRRVSIVLVFFLFTIVPVAAEQPGVLRIGADIDYRPYSYLDAAGTPRGFDIEVVRILADRLGLEPDYYLAPWSDVQQRLQRDEIDVLVGMLFTVSRTENFVFTAPYNTDTISIFVRADSQINDIRDLEGKDVAILEGDAIPETVLIANGITSPMQGHPTFTEVLADVSGGTADYALLPYAVGMELLKHNDFDNIHVVGPPVYTIQYRLGVHRSKIGFRDQLNRELQEFVESDEYDDLRDRWLRFHRRELSFRSAVRYVGPVALPIAGLLLVGWVWTLKKRIHSQTREIARQNAELQTLAMIDALTGLTNRRLFDTMADAEFRRSKRVTSTFSILFIDLDHFKELNDRYGHEVGDTVLVEFARRAGNEVREYDVLARYGGEEFVALLRDTGYNEAYDIAERIRRVCETTPVQLGEAGSTPTLTVSVGVAAHSPDDTSYHDALRRADEAMYRAKRAGRNRVDGTWLDA